MRGTFGLSSSREKRRPTIGWTPSIGSMPAEVYDAVARTGSESAGEIDTLVDPAFERLEGGGVALEVEKFGRGDPKMTESAVGEVGEFGKDADEASGLGVREGSEENRVDDAEDGRRSPDAERQAGHGGRGEAGFIGEKPDGVADVLRKGGHRP